jgi:hypothetical protein
MDNRTRIAVCVALLILIALTSCLPEKKIALEITKIQLEVISKMVNWRSNPSWERANGPYRRTMGSGRTFVT